VRWKWLSLQNLTCSKIDRYVDHNITRDSAVGRRSDDFDPAVTDRVLEHVGLRVGCFACPGDYFHGRYGEVVCGEDAADPPGLEVECLTIVMDDVRLWYDDMTVISEMCCS
jgi:hypothetical protein